MSSCTTASRQLPFVLCSSVTRPIRVVVEGQRDSSTHWDTPPLLLPMESASCRALDAVRQCHAAAGGGMGKVPEGLGCGAPGSAAAMLERIGGRRKQIPLGSSVEIREPSRAGEVPSRANSSEARIKSSRKAWLSVGIARCLATIPFGVQTPQTLLSSGRSRC